jgi:hypothetical protein
MDLRYSGEDDTFRARARAFSSMIRTPVGQTSLQTRQPEQ